MEDLIQLIKLYFNVIQNHWIMFFYELWSKVTEDFYFLDTLLAFSCIQHFIQDMYYTQSERILNPNYRSRKCSYPILELTIREDIVITLFSVSEQNIHLCNNVLIIIIITWIQDYSM